MTLPLSQSRVVAVAGLVAAVLALGCKKNKPADSGGDSNTNTPAATGTPGGGAGAAGATDATDNTKNTAGVQTKWSEVRDTVGGFRVLVPGTNRALNMATAPEEKKKRQMIMFQNAVGPNSKSAQVTTHSFVPLAGTKIGSSPDELYAGLLAHRDGVMTFHDLLVKESLTLGGRPALRVMTKANNFSPPPKIGDAETQQRLEEGYKKDIARRWTYLVTTTATRVIVILIQTEGDPDPAELKAIADSFAFL